MIITELEILKVPPSWVWLRIHTDEGITGIASSPVFPTGLAAGQTPSAVRIRRKIGTTRQK